MKHAKSNIDNRPLVKDLLVKYSTQIEHVRRAIEADKFYVADRYDNLWILRFILSHKGSKTAATKAALKTMEFRNKHNLNEIGNIQQILTNDPLENESDVIKIMRRYSACCDDDAFVLSLPDPDRGLVKFIRMAKMKMDTITDEFSEEDMILVYVGANEASAQISSQGRLASSQRNFVWLTFQDWV